MDQRWKRLPLLVIILLFWRNADGFKGGAYSGTHHGWGQPSDTFSPRTVQSSMSEVHVTGILPVEEVGSSLFPNKPLKSKSKLNLLQFVKGGSNSYQSTSHAQTTPSSSVSASLPLSLSQQPSKSLASSGSTIPGVAGGLSLETQYAGSGSGQVVSTLGERSSFPAKLGVSGQSTSDTLHVSSSQETSVKLAEASLPVFSKKVSDSSSSAPGATSSFLSSPALLSESLGQPESSQGEVGYSGLSQGASSQYTPDSNTMIGSPISSQSSGDQSFLASGFSLLEEVAGLGPLDLSTKSSEMSSQFKPFVVSSQSTNSQSSPSLHMVSPQSSYKSTDAATPLYTQGSVSYSSLSSQAQGSATSRGSSGAELFASSVQSVPTRVGSGSYSGVSQSLSASSLYTPGSLMANKLDSLPLGVSGQSTNVQSSPNVSTSSTQSRSGTQLATSSHFIPVQGGSSSVRLSLKPQGTLGPYAPSSPTKYVSAPMSAPQATTNSGSSYRAISQVGSLSQMGASGQFASRGGNYYRGLLPPSQATSSQYALGYSKPISSPQSTSSQPTSALSSRKQYNSASQGSGSQFGASTGFASQGMSSSYSGSVQSQGTTSQFAPGSLSSYPGLSLSSPQAGPFTVQGSRKQLTSTYTGSSGTQVGSSTLFTLHGSTAYGGSRQPQDTASPFTPSSPYESVYCKCVLSPQGVDRHSTSVRSSQKQFTSSYGAQSGSSTPFTLQGSITFDGSPQPQGVASQSTIWGSPKQLTSTFAGSSDTQAGSSTPFILQGGTAYGGSSQPQDTTSPSAPGSYSSHASVSLSSPQAGPSTNVQASRKRFTSAYQGSSGASFGASTGFASQGMSSSYSGSDQSQGTTSQFAPGSPSSYLGLLLSSPHAGPSTNVPGSLKRLASTFIGSSGTQAGSSTPFILQGSTAYGGSPQPQDAASQSAPGSQSSASVSLSSPQAGPSTTVQGSLKRLASIIVE
ncbi:serine-rich adhesin for platelets-like isoform X2 [Sinocyclocheilus anshuiensis]|uniref:serine-rich adhesin for platelets-like isoform X2 n=1 Tax=Sinocyclocheilus anshuiensis TaxID=1608454 RepID=UPI0007BA13A2|nr:PREDICTED: serine-rich adhesin for platelets-like isoform X2 [Sinocyclocheilus anshuiensis]